MKTVKTIRGGSGVGDAIYLHSIVGTLARTTDLIYSVRTMHPQLFKFLPSNVKTEPHNKIGCDIVAHYSSRKSVKTTDQFQDMLITAGLDKGVLMSTSWDCLNKRLVDSIREKASGKKILIVNELREPMGRQDKFGLELLPTVATYNYGLEHIKKILDCFVVRIGGKARSSKKGCVDLDLVGKTSKSDIMDLGNLGDVFYGQCSHIIPLAEIFHKPLMCPWGHKVGMSKNTYMQTILPDKILHGKHSSSFYDNFTNNGIEKRIEKWISLTDLN